MEEELDYRIEAARQRLRPRLRRGLRRRGARCPVNSEQVIVSEWLEGTPLSRIIAEGTQAQRMRQPLWPGVPAPRAEPRPAPSMQIRTAATSG